MIETIERILEQLEEGSINFEEAGDWLHNHGDEIVSTITELEEHIEMLEEEKEAAYNEHIETLEEEKEAAYDEGHSDGYHEGYNDGQSNGYQEGLEAGQEEGGEQ